MSKVSDFGNIFLTHTDANEKIAASPLPRKLAAILVRMARLELAQENSHHPLKVARLPFRHIRVDWECKDRHFF